MADIRRGEDDGSSKFTFTSKDLSKVDITVFVPDLDEYPKAHKYLIYVTSEDVPENFTSSLERVQDACSGHNLPHLLGRIVGALTLSPDPTDESSDDEDEDTELESDLDWEADIPDGAVRDLPGDCRSSAPKNWEEGAPTKTFTRKLKLQLKEDLRHVCEAGFRVGVFGDFKGEVFYITISIRISKLGISDEALAAWLLDKDKYFIVIIHYTNLYKTLEWLLQPENRSRVRREMQMWAGLSTSYKPSLYECIQVFTKVKDRGSAGLDGVKGGEVGGLHSFFMSNAITELLNLRLVPLIKYRLQGDLGWEGAEALFKDIEAFPTAPPMEYQKYRDLQSEPKTALNPIVAADALSKQQFRGIGRSFPLIAMQYAIRHLVRCTEFCLVCHDKIQSDFEAMKPYVCDSPLCLYQYMSLGFGPSIESEILTQPTVVDLLVSFCYRAAEALKLRTFPTGMNILVPSESKHQARYFEPANRVVFSTPFGSPGVKVGDWIYFSPCKDRAPCHLRVAEVYWPEVHVERPINVPQDSRNQLPSSPLADSAPPAFYNSTQGEGFAGSVCVHTRAFDEVNIRMKCLAITRLLDLLPSVGEMRAWLKSNSLSGLNASLRTWVDRILPSSLNILRWIIASNRSCIVPADHELGADGLPVAMRKNDSKVLGVSDCLQFRFAMGAPDKEQRFVNSVKEAGDRLNLQYPTLFAFHGSPLANWHSIVRSGLNYESMAHGRAFGNGVYHSLDMGVSLGYSTNRTNHGWLESILNVQNAVCLNEIVNAPREFVSSSPHLVVDKLNWIQTRYLFVKVANIDIQTPTSPLSDNVEYLQQDIRFSPRGRAGIALQIPALGSKSHIQAGAPNARTKDLQTSLPNSPDRSVLDEFSMLDSATNIIDVENDDARSDTTETTDVMAYFSDEEDENMENKNTSPHCSDTGVILFQPDTHNISSVLLLPPPTYASPAGTRRLTADLHHLLSLQKKYPLEELGFYMNPSSVSNVYQWHIELHSFPPDIPLSADLAAKNLSSVLLEFRFGPNFPMSPPFVRVVRPRFLAFAEGGGGHVTAGGALCMELLTNSGWSAASSMESVLLQIRMAITSEVKPARLVPGVVRDYTAGEARDAYVRACRAHGWKVPQDFLKMI
ncbi:unnamed protein product [Tuber melanosporum]|uniref:(Perigord truffle) hypothetical protein n=1 Tax=Tuber melanosporum (strain Mel28) TaxID=656061 RepID=D5G6L1_TUBMM|nr:uncharacterized protein GSTUM_00001820001 [Tuber melanosporum]CAZ80154.1 unnamed protein product [Tuber melanosporum]